MFSSSDNCKRLYGNLSEEASLKSYKTKKKNLIRIGSAEFIGMIYTHLQKHFLRLDVLKPASLWAAAPQSPGFEQIPTRVISPMGLGNVSAGLLGASEKISSNAGNDEHTETVKSNIPSGINRCPPRNAWSRKDRSLEITVDWA
ncbi:hypothetical protein RRG08_010987 [Elysia crispata]|uniref:Uncharacterized protein n=1 Tax=Elysia crispata TaxID=231223 RepID=A0AAE1DKG6_9GAST|nr:hypothetical protein RRG08_010987 [Elysia crispata]